MDDKPKLRRFGVTYSGEGVSHEKSETISLKFSQATDLQNLAEEYHFYTPALMHIGVRLGGRDPYTDFEAESNVEIGRVSIRFAKPIFRGMDLGKDKEWNYVLYGMPVGHWEAFNTFMGQLAFQDRDLDLLTRIRTQEIRIPDPLYLDRQTLMVSNLPTVSVMVYALDSNKGCTFVRLRGNPILDLPMVIRSEHSYNDTLLYAHELSAAHDPNPYGRIDEAGSQPDMSIEEIELRQRYLAARENKDESDS